MITKLTHFNTVDSYMEVDRTYIILQGEADAIYFSGYYSNRWIIGRMHISNIGKHEKII